MTRFYVVHYPHPSKKMDIFTNEQYPSATNMETPNNPAPNPTLVYWEEFILSLQEFFQAWDRFQSNPSQPVRNRI